MTRVQRCLTFSLLVIMIGAFPVMGADFYETQLNNGIEAARTGRLNDAIDYFRIANFGFLDHTTLLVEGLARLGLAESAAGRKEDAQKTLARFVSVERQFPSYAKANLDPATRASFEKLLLATISKETIAAVPSLAVLVPTSAKELRDVTPEKRRQWLEQQAKKEPGNVDWPMMLAADAQERGDERGVAKWTDRALKIDAAYLPARVMRLSSFTAKRDYKRALAEIGKMPDDAGMHYPSVVADSFVVYTRTENFAAADALVGRIPEAEMAREDVADALSAYHKREAAKAAPSAPAADSPAPAQPPAALAATPASANASATAAPAQSPAPAGTPVQTPDDALDNRIKSGQGSFSGAADPVADALSRSKKLVRDGDPVEAERVIRDGLRRNPENRELRLAMIESACLARDWRTAVSQISVVDPFRSGEERYMFYASVSLFELGRKDEAKPLMKRAVPKLVSSPYVDHYSKAVMAE